MADIGMRLGSDVLVVQGFLEEGLRAQGFTGSVCALNATEPETVEDLLGLYRVAGADCALTNTQGATSPQLASEGLEGLVAQINADGVRMARDAGFTHVLARIAPCGVADADAAEECYAEQAEALASAGPDAFALTSFADLSDCLAAVSAARTSADVPVLVSLTPRATEQDEVDALARAIAEAGVAAIGCDSLTPADTLRVLEWMRGACDLPLLALPALAPLPRGHANGPAASRSLDRFAEGAVEELRAGATVIGSSQGSTPAATGAIFAAVGRTQLP